MLGGDLGDSGVTSFAQALARDLARAPFVKIAIHWPLPFVCSQLPGSSAPSSCGCIFNKFKIPPISGASSVPDAR